MWSFLKLLRRTVHSESTQTPLLFPHFATLQPYSKIDLKHFFFQSTHNTPIITKQCRCRAIFRSLQRCSIDFKSRLWLSHSRTFRDLSRRYSCVVLAVCLVSLSCWKVNLHPSLRSWTLWSRFSSRFSVLFSIHLCLTPAEFPCPCCWKTSPQHDAATTMLGIVPSFLQTWCLAFRPNNSILVSSDQRILFLMVWESLGAFCQTPSGLSCEEWLQSGYSTIKAWLLECCRDGFPSGRFSHLHRWTLELFQSDHQVLGHLPDQGVSPPIAQEGSKLLPLMEATVFLGTFNAVYIYMLYLFGTLPHFCASAQSCLGQSKSNQLNLPQVDSNQVVLTSQGWSMETGCTWAQFRVS